ncbi:hypothetical protein KIPE111705_02835 [Kibdelosporangium persicum]|uniref:Cell wall-active antibiotics response LiaF-like C-terminal domain-containing protein n=1 Tax=Kibdelosporangium persicum TaxID=2698649 RepID=A0ABX2F444_9PSEU|nr:hypothetical protein [Kibdelosporangium persicum]
MLLALLAVSAGSVLAASGPGGFARLGTVVLDNAGWLLLAAGAVALLSAIAPPGALLGPLVLIVAGLVVVLDPPRPEVWTLSGGIITVGGGLFLMRRAGTEQPNADPVMRRSAVLFPRKVRLRSDELCPERLFLRSVLSVRITANLRAAAPPQRGIIELLITCWGGQVRVTLPDHWTVVGGRLAAAKLISLDGVLDHARTYPDLSLIKEAAEFTELTEARFAKHGSDDQEPVLAIVHVMGLGGVVRLDRQPGGHMTTRVG